MEDAKFFVKSAIDLIVSYKWIIFFVIIIWKRNLVKDLIDPVLSIFKKMKEILITLDGKKIKIDIDTFEEKIRAIKADAKDLYPKKLEYTAIPYIEASQIENEYSRLKVLEDLFEYKLENIKDENVQRFIGAYYYMKRDFNKSRKFYLIAESLADPDVGLYCIIGNTYRKSETDKALEYYKKSLDLEKDFGWAHYYEGLIYLDLQDSPDEINKRFQDAISAFNSLIERKKFDYLPYFGLASVYYRQKQYQLAIDNLDKEIKNQENFAPLYYNRAIAKIYLKKDRKSIVKDLRKCIDLNYLLKTWIEKDQDFKLFEDDDCYKCLIGKLSD